MTASDARVSMKLAAEECCQRVTAYLVIAVVDGRLGNRCARASLDFEAHPNSWSTSEDPACGGLEPRGLGLCKAELLAKDVHGRSVIDGELDIG